MVSLTAKATGADMYIGLGFAPVWAKIQSITSPDLSLMFDLRHGLAAAVGGIAQDADAPSKAAVTAANGITLYKGELLPEIFHNQVIHCDAGPGVVWAWSGNAQWHCPGAVKTILK